MPLGSLKWVLWAIVAVTLAASDVALPPADLAAAGHPHYRIGQPYKIDGVWYYPKENWSYDETGVASWYGKPFHGRRTADGEVFNLHALSAAHRTLPMPVVVRVTNLDNGRTVKLRVNDRGPFVATGDRIIDVSRHAAKVLGFEHSGLAPVRVRIDVPASMKVAAAAGRTRSLFNIPLPSFALTLPSLAIPALGLSSAELIALASALLGGFGFWGLVLDDGRPRRPALSTRAAMLVPPLPQKPKA